MVNYFDRLDTPAVRGFAPWTARGGCPYVSVGCAGMER